MKKIYATILLLCITAIAPVSSFPVTVDPEDMDLPEEKWELRYNLFESLWSGDPQYYNQSHEVTIKGTHGTVYIKGIFPEYPDAWIKGQKYKYLIIEGPQELTQIDGKPIYLQMGEPGTRWTSANNRELTFEVSVKPDGYHIWRYGDNGTNRDELLNGDIAIWATDQPNTPLSFTRTYYFDGTVTDNLGTHPMIYRYPSFYRIGSSGIMDTVIDEQEKEDSRVFDLSGRQVDPDHLGPGIYIRNGKKFVISR